MKIKIILIGMCLYNSELLYVSDQSELLDILSLDGSSKATTGLSTSVVTPLLLLTSIEKSFPSLITFAIFFKNIKAVRFSDSVTQKSLFSLDLAQGVECDLADQIYVERHSKNPEGFRRIEAHYEYEKNNDLSIEVDALGKRRCMFAPGHYKIVVDGKLFYYNKAFDR